MLSTLAVAMTVPSVLMVALVRGLDVLDGKLASVAVVGICKPSLGLLDDGSLRGVLVVIEAFRSGLGVGLLGMVMICL
jgi:hypothetical protein